MAISKPSTPSAPASLGPRVMIISSDCHAGTLPSEYNEYLPQAMRGDAMKWWVTYVKEMIARTGTFFDQEAVDDYTEKSGGTANFHHYARAADDVEDARLLALLNDGSSPFSPREGEWDMEVRRKELDDDGAAGEVVFPQMAPFGAGLMQYRNPIDPEQNLAGNRAYNRWLAAFCNRDPGRHAGVALINLDDIEVTCDEVRNARKMGLFGGVLLPTSTGTHPFYHHPRYEPLWATCADVGMPLQMHSGWSPDYGDIPSATAMYISEVDMWAQRIFTALVWSGAFERHPDLRLVMTEVGTQWIIERLRVLEFKAGLPFFKHFHENLSHGPRGYFEKQCYIGASFLPVHEGAHRHQIGVDRIMWGSDYPHIEGTWPNTMEHLKTTFAGYSEVEARAMLGGNALDLYDFDPEVVTRVAREIGPDLSDIVGGAA